MACASTLGTHMGYIRPAPQWLVDPVEGDGVGDDDTEDTGANTRAGRRCSWSSTMTSTTLLPEGDHRSIAGQGDRIGTADPLNSTTSCFTVFGRFGVLLVSPCISSPEPHVL